MLKKIIFLLVSLAVATVGAIAAMKNGQDVVFNYYFSEVSLPLVVLVFSALCLGALLGLLLSSLWVFKQHRQIRRLEQSKALVQKELDNLRGLRGEA